MYKRSIINTSTSTKLNAALITLSHLPLKSSSNSYFTKLLSYTNYGSSNNECRNCIENLGLDDELDFEEVMLKLTKQIYPNKNINYNLYSILYEYKIISANFELFYYSFLIDHMRAKYPELPFNHVNKLIGEDKKIYSPFIFIIDRNNHYSTAVRVGSIYTVYDNVDGDVSIDGKTFDKMFANNIYMIMYGR